MPVTWESVAAFYVRRLAGATILREPADTFWGERVAYVTNPEGNLLSLANRPAQ